QHFPTRRSSDLTHGGPHQGSQQQGEPVPWAHVYWPSLGCWLWRYCPGGTPTCLLNADEKLAVLLKPAFAAMWARGISVLASQSLLMRMRAMISAGWQVFLCNLQRRLQSLLGAL